LIHIEFTLLTTTKQTVNQDCIGNYLTETLQEYYRLGNIWGDLDLKNTSVFTSSFLWIFNFPWSLLLHLLHLYTVATYIHYIFIYIILNTKHYF